MKKSECPPGMLVTPGVLSPKSRKLKDFPGGPVVETACPLQRARVCSLVGEPKIPHATRCGKKKRKTKQNQGLIPHQASSTRIKLQPSNGENRRNLLCFGHAP